MIHFISTEKYTEAIKETCNYFNATTISTYNIDYPYCKYEDYDITIFTDKLYEINKLHFDDINNTDEFKKYIKQSLIYAVIISENKWFSNSNVIDYLEQVTTERFKCEKIKDEKKCVLSNYNEFNIYLDTINSYIHNKIKLFNLKTNIENRDYVEGININFTNTKVCNECLNCVSSIKWNQLHKLPKLPKKYGCTCEYSARYVDDDLKK